MEQSCYAGNCKFFKTCRRITGDFPDMFTHDCQKIVDGVYECCQDCDMVEHYCAIRRPYEDEGGECDGC